MSFRAEREIWLTNWYYQIYRFLTPLRSVRNDTEILILQKSIAFHRKEVFDSKRNSMQQSSVFASLNFIIRSLCLFKRQCFSKIYDKLQRGIILFQSCKIHFGELGRSYLPGLNQFWKLQYRIKCNILNFVWFVNSDIAKFNRLSLPWKFLSIVLQIPHKIDMVGNIFLPEPLIGFEIIVQSFQNLLSFFLGQFDADEILCCCNHFNSNLIFILPGSRWT